MQIDFILFTLYKIKYPNTTRSNLKYLNTSDIMKNLATIKFTTIISALLMMLLTAGITNAQVVEPPEDLGDLQEFPLSYNMDTDEIDWEGFTYVPFEGAALERIPNPDQSELNDTEYVLQYIKAGGEAWAGFFYHTDEIMDLTEDSEFRLNVWSNRDGIQALVKLEMRDAPDVNTGDLFADITVDGEWTELVWNFSELLDLSAHSGTPYDRVVIIMDLEGGAGDGGDPFIWYLDDFTFDSGEATSNEIAEAGIPQSLQLNQNYPNPFNPTTNIEFALPESSHATLEVFDMLGQRVATLVDQTMSAGQHSVNFDASNLSSGIYIYRIQAGNSIQTRKLTLIK